jgi:quercetin dioxygenase-like cupin family protein
MATSPHSQRRPAARVDAAQRSERGPYTNLQRDTDNGAHLLNSIVEDLRYAPVWALVTQTEGREGVMLTRRGFAGFASCAICGITEFVATAASAQGTPPAASGGVTRKILSQADGPAPGYETLLVEATIEPGVAVGRHTHPGIESAYVMEGGFELPIQGQPTRVLKVGDAFQIPPQTPHAGGKAGDAKTRILITYVVEKGKPLASPA